MGEKSSIDEVPALTEKARVVALMEKERTALLLTCLLPGHAATTASLVSGSSSSEYALPAPRPLVHGRKEHTSSFMNQKKQSPHT